MEDEVKYIPKDWYYMGIRLRNGKKHYAWCSDPDSSYYSLYDKPLVSPNPSIGGAYTFYESEDGQKFKTTGEYSPKFANKYVNKEQAIKWEAEDEVARQQLSLKSLHTKVSKVEPLDELLGRIKQATANLSRVERRALLTKITETLFD